MSHKGLFICLMNKLVKEIILWNTVYLSQSVSPSVCPSVFDWSVHSSLCPVKMWNVHGSYMQVRWISFCFRQLCIGYAFATTGAVAVALGLNHLTKVRCTPVWLTLIRGSLVSMSQRVEINWSVYILTGEIPINLNECVLIHCYNCFIFTVRAILDW